MYKASSRDFESIYVEVRHVIENARDSLYRNINFNMVLAYWNIGKIIVKEGMAAYKWRFAENLNTFHLNTFHFYRIHFIFTECVSFVPQTHTVLLKTWSGSKLLIYLK